MRQDGVPPGKQSFSLSAGQFPVSRQMAIGVILIVALLAFELFNFDTTQFALESLLGDIRFLGLSWATILAIAFCAIDFAGLARLFTPEKGSNEPKEIWYLTGAWLLGTSMNAIMTWWAVSLTLLTHPLGNEVMSREQLLKVVPIFVAALVWLTRILFIGSLTSAGEKLLYGGDSVPTSRSKAANQPAAPARAQQAAPPPAPRPQPVLPTRPVATPPARPAMSAAPLDETPVYTNPYQNTQRANHNNNEPLTPARPQRPNTNGRVGKRPPGPVRPNMGGMSASPNNRN